ncbi:MAG: 6-phosphogluconolactonase [Acidimicrobiia bacterium]
MEYKVFDTTETLARAAADIIEAEVARWDDLALGLAGGSTPARTYRELAGRRIDWSAATAWLTDERWVTPTHPDSNQLMARQELVGRTGVRFLAPNTELPSPVAAAVAYANDLSTFFDSEMRTVTMLGIGTDGHTASLFPGTDALGVVGETYVANYAPSVDSWRLTATFDLIATSDIVLFLVAGESKAEIISSIAAGAEVPAARVTATEKVLWLLDRDAAAGL